MKGKAKSNGVTNLKKFYKIFNSSVYIEMIENNKVTEKTQSVLERIRYSKESGIRSRGSFNKGFKFHTANKQTVIISEAKTTVKALKFKEGEVYQTIESAGLRGVNKCMDRVRHFSGGIPDQNTFCSFVHNSLGMTQSVGDQSGLMKHAIDLSKSMLGGRNGFNTSMHLGTFLKRVQEFSYDSVERNEENRQKLVFVGTTYDGGVRTLHECYSHLNLPFVPGVPDRKSMLSVGVNPSANAGLIETAFTAGFKKTIKMTSKRGGIYYSYTVACSVGDRLKRLKKEEGLFSNERITCGGREKLIKDIKSHDFVFCMTRLIQVPSFVTLIIMGPFQMAINRAIQEQTEGTGLFFGMKHKDAVDRSEAYKKCRVVITGDVKNHDSRVTPIEIIAAISSIRTMFPKGNFLDKVFIYICSTCINYYIFAPTGHVFRIFGAMQSGNRFTSIINTFICRLRIYYMFINNRTGNRFIGGDLNNLVISNGGDDLEFGFANRSPEEFKRLAEKFVIDYYRMFGAELTDIKIYKAMKFRCNDPDKNPEFLGKALLGNGLYQTSASRGLRSIGGNSKNWLDMKANVLDTFKQALYSGDLPVYHLDSLARMFVLISNLYRNEVKSIIQYDNRIPEGVPGGVFGLNLGESKRDQMKEYIEAFDFCKEEPIISLIKDTIMKFYIGNQASYRLPPNANRGEVLIGSLLEADSIKDDLVLRIYRNDFHTNLSTIRIPQKIEKRGR